MRKSLAAHLTHWTAIKFNPAALDAVRRHARESMDKEICGVLVGNVADGITQVEAAIAGENAAQAGAHVTFTHEAWEHIYKVKDRDFAALPIVGWYHSHPGFGIFLSDYDLFIHENFFNAKHQIALVVDPQSDEEGCFGWISGEVQRVNYFPSRVAPGERIAGQADRTPDNVPSEDTSFGTHNFFTARSTVLLAFAVLFFTIASYRLSWRVLSLFLFALTVLLFVIAAMFLVISKNHGKE